MTVNLIVTLSGERIDVKPGDVFEYVYGAGGVRTVYALVVDIDHKYIRARFLSRYNNKYECESGSYQHSHVNFFTHSEPKLVKDPSVINFVKMMFV